MKCLYCNVQWSDALLDCCKNSHTVLWYNIYLVRSGVMHYYKNTHGAVIQFFFIVRNHGVQSTFLHQKLQRPLWFQLAGYSWNDNANGRCGSSWLGVAETTMAVVVPAGWVYGWNDNGRCGSSWLGIRLKRQRPLWFQLARGSWNYNGRCGSSWLGIAETTMAVVVPAGWNYNGHCGSSWLGVAETTTTIVVPAGWNYNGRCAQLAG